MSYVEMDFAHGGVRNASEILYDDTNTQLGQDNVQGAIEELNNAFANSLSTFLDLDYANGTQFKELTFTAPSDGCIFLYPQTTSYTWGNVNVNGNFATAYTSDTVTGQAGRLNFQLYVRKGDVVTISVGGGSIILSQGVGNFLPFKTH